MEFLDTLKLGFANNLLVGNLPDKILLDKFSEHIAKEKNTTLESFGLFDSNQANYNTYFPDVTEEDLSPKDKEFIQPVFRALSEVIVHKSYNPVDFSLNGVLKKSKSLLIGTTINADHETSIGNALGAVKEVSWQDASKTDTGITIPAGINAKLKIDGKSHPRVARAIMMDPPSIHSTSVTVEFLWDKSHQSLSSDEFFAQLGKKDKNGDIIRRIATNVRRYPEISLVSHGADPFAQLVKENGIINPNWANISYNSFTGDVKKKQNFFFFDNKTDIIKNSIPDEPIDNDYTDNDKLNIMNKELIIFLSALLMVPIQNPEAPEQTELTALQDKVTEAINLSNSLKTEVDTTNEELVRLKDIETAYNAEKENLTNATVLAKFKTDTTASLKSKVLSNYKLIEGDKANNTLVKMIEEASFETLSALNITYETQLAEKFPLACKKCGSKEVNRSTAKQAEENNEAKTANILKKRRTNGFKLHEEVKDAE